MKNYVSCMQTIAFALAVAGCGGPDTTVFAVGLGIGSEGNDTSIASTSIQLVSQRCLLLSHAKEQPSCTPESHYICAGAHPVLEGEPVRWKCQTKDGQTFTQITIDSKPYDLARGRLFLLSRKAGMLTIQQLSPDMTKLEKYPSAVKELAADNLEIADFFSQ